MPCCVAINCSNRSEKGFRLFRFPADDVRKQKWIQNMRKPSWMPTKHSHLCEKHFEESQYENRRLDRWKKLKSNAIPTLFNFSNPPPKKLLNKIQRKKRVTISSTNKEQSLLHQQITSPRIKKKRSQKKKVCRVPKIHKNNGIHQDHLYANLKNEEIQKSNLREKKLLEEISEIYLQSTCLICDSNQNLKYMFKEYEVDDGKENYPSMISECFNIELSNLCKDYMLTKICERCIKRLRIMIIFKKEIENANKKIIKYHKSTFLKNNFEEKYDSAESNIKGDNEEMVVVENIVTHIEAYDNPDSDYILLIKNEDSEFGDICENMRQGNYFEFQNIEDSKKSGVKNKKTNIIESVNLPEKDINPSKQDIQNSLNDKISESHVLVKNHSFTDSKQESEIIESEQTIDNSLNNELLEINNIVKNNSVNLKNELKNEIMELEHNIENCIDDKTCKINTIVKNDSVNLKNKVEESEHDIENCVDATICETINNGKNNSQTNSDNIFEDKILLLYSILKLEPYTLKCPICEDAFVIHENFIRHYVCHLDSIFCYLCEQTFDHYKFLYRHLSKHLSKNLKRNSSMNGISQHLGKYIKKKYICKICEGVYSSANCLSRHVRQCHLNIKIYGCPQCGERFKSFQTKLTHQAKVHGVSSTTFLCPICAKQFLIKRYFDNHLKMHDKADDFVCHICGTQLFSQTSLRNHVLKHTVLNPHYCDVCGKCFAKRKTLNIHFKIHANIRDYKCDICGRSFIQKSSLKSHLRIHNKT